MSVTLSEQTLSSKPSLVPEYDDCKSDITMLSSTQGQEPSNGRRSPSESDRRSIYSYASSMDREFILKDVFGRTFYLMPADVDEHGRLDIQHQMLKAKLGGLYWPAHHVRRILAPRPEGCDPPAVLDIGTGSGSWAIDMAEEFPHAEVVGMDLVPANLAKNAPPNCRFECDDANQGLSHYKNAFDVVHMRCGFRFFIERLCLRLKPLQGVTAGIEDGLGFYHSLPDLLRPGGILLVINGNSMHGENREMLTQEDPTALDFSWMALLARTYFNMTKARVAKLVPEKAERAGAISARKFQDWLKEMPDWEDQGHKKILIPMGPWPPGLNGRDRYASELLRQNFFRLAASWRPAFLINGYQEDVVDDWITKARDEIVNMRAHTYTGYLASWALKPRIPASGIPTTQ